MPKIRVDRDLPIINGQTLTFQSPANCSDITGLVIYYPEGDTTKSKDFKLVDAHGVDVGSGTISLFAANALVKVVLDIDQGKAFVQNADTNAYLEGKLAEKYSPNNKPSPADIGAAKIQAPNDMLHNGNEYTFIPDNYYGEVYINHRAGGGDHNGQISNYHFCNGSGQYATLIANYFKGKFQGADARPIYNNAEVAMLSDVTAEQAGALPTSGGTVNGSITIQRANYPGFTLKNTTVNGELAVTEADDGTALLQNNSDVTGANNYAAIYIKPAETGINNFLQFGLSINGAWSGGVILHSQNFRDHIPRETWTFTLEDGSTVTKAVYVG